MSPAYLLVVPAYVLGTFPSALLVGGRVGHDPTREGSGNPGASNVYRVAGRRAGLTVAAADVAKSLVPTLAGLAVSGRPVAVACWFAATVGHVLPATRLGRGGKGVATAGGGAFVLYPVLAPVLVGVFLVVARVSGKASPASLTVAVALPVGVAAVGSPHWEVAAAAAVAALVLVRHVDNIERLLVGRERTYRSGGESRPPAT